MDADDRPVGWSRALRVWSHPLRHMRMPSIIDVAELLYDVVTCQRRPRAAGLVARHLNRIRPGAPVLDIGAGTAEIAAEIERVTGASVTACDVDLGELQRGVARPGGGRVVGDGQALPFGTGTFQAAYLISVLHHVPDQARALAEVGRTLVPGGLLAIIEYDGASGLATLLRGLARLTGRRCILHTRASLLALVEAAGLRAECHRLDRARFVIAGMKR